jgi:hypothetical protein
MCLKWESMSNKLSFLAQKATLSICMQKIFETHESVIGFWEIKMNFLENMPMCALVAVMTTVAHNKNQPHAAVNSLPLFTN